MNVDNLGLTVYVILQTQSINLNWFTMTNTGLKVIYNITNVPPASVMPLESVEDVQTCQRTHAKRNVLTITEMRENGRCQWLNATEIAFRRQFYIELPNFMDSTILNPVLGKINLYIHMYTSTHT